MEHSRQRLFVWLMMLVGPSLANQTLAAALRVPEDHATIAAAMSAAVSGDSVLVGPGVWDQHVTLPGGYRVISLLKGGVTLRSTDGPTVTELRLNGGTIAGQASALWAENYADPIVVEGLRFTATGVGEGIRLDYGASTVVRDCVFEELDIGTFEGAGISALYVDELHVMDSRFVQCRTSTIGSGISVWNGHATIERCHFEGNTGTALDCTKNSGLFLYQVLDCVFLDNVADGAGALRLVAGGAHLVEGCWFEGNRATSSSGGAARISTGYVRSNVFLRNTSERGGGALWFSLVGLQGGIEGNLFVENQMVTSASQGAAVQESQPVVPIRRNIFVGNTGGTAIGHPPPLGPPPEISCNLFWNNPSGEFNGTWNPSLNRFSDPLFCGALESLFTLDSDSEALPENSGGCEQIGPFGVGCGTVSLTPESWARLKAAFRSERGAER